MIPTPKNEGSSPGSVIASEAKQSNGGEADLDCFVALLLAMTI